MSEHFFPNQSPFVQEQEARLRGLAAMLPQPERLVLYEIFSACTPGLTATTFRIEGDFVIACQSGYEIAFPNPVPLVKLSHIVFGYEQWLQRKYCLPGFVEVQPGDVVVDCGAYVAGFSLSASRIASQLHAFEPDRNNAACVRRNLANVACLHLNECGLYDRSDEMMLNVSANSVEHSLLLPDDGTVVEKRRISVVSLKDYARTKSIDNFDFVKIEAEGVELEVFAGLGEMLPRKIAIDVSPERNGESPADEFQTRLTSLGYEVRQRAHVMFARLRDSESTTLINKKSGVVSANMTGSTESDPKAYKVWGIAPKLIYMLRKTFPRQMQATTAADNNSPAHGACARSVPPIIYSLWLQGLDNAPKIVRMNFERWARLNPNYRLEILDQAAVNQLLSDLPLSLDALTPQTISDITRTRLLLKTGGIWADASVFPTQPLDEWLPAKITNSGFFAFERPGPDRPISSWFLAASPNNSMIRAWWDKVLNYWSTAREPMEGIPDNPVAAVNTPARFPYFWFHYLFQLLLESDAGFATAWATCGKLPADAPHAMQMHFAERPQLEPREVAELAALAPLHKLNWRAPYPLEILAAL